ncbi:hypothetical protein ACLKA6_016780 [Drosophila palustris]
MNVKKRPRLEFASTTTTTTLQMSSSSYGNGNGTGNLGSLGSMATTTTPPTTATAMPTATANGLFLTSVGEINNGAQIYLTICGDNDDDDDDDNISNESQEFYAIESIKQEPGQDALELDAALHHALLPTNLQLPTGCEIYLVKDTILNTTTTTAAAASGATTTTIVPSINQLITQSAAMASIKLEPDSMSSMSTSTNVLFVKKPTTHNIYVAGKETVSSSSIATNQPPGGVQRAPPPPPAPQPPGGAPSAPSQHYKLDVKLDAYKKRDDKRRATHNEVERRRRDKINCWIFKLKEMLPTEGNCYKPTTTTTTHSDAVDSSKTITTTTTATTSIKSNQNNGRTPPNDSKSQILIKACDYIKSMQNEIDTLRDCLREAESLRVSNQQLRDELDNLKQRQQQELQELRFNTAGGSFNVTLNSLNSSATSDLFDGIDAPPNLATVSSINFTKRGLMIADYDE